MDIILVNEKDEPMGTMEKLEVHQKALLHRAFSIFIFNGIRFPNKDATPNENAISVAVGTPHPLINAVFKLKAININAGTNMPPKAAPKGNTAFLKEANSPATNSLFISVPAIKKNIPIKKLLTHSKQFSGKCKAALNSILLVQKCR